MTTRFKVGSLVTLKSGGPVMTVQSEYDQNYSCQWFAGKKLDHGTFPQASLEEVVEE
ncbi:YodC family protein [Photobacterium chitinilyticum]|uniref:YodC family protein n=1 Tax=Photobacterium chitinilyticum TaxID=2485123 RepID=UPI003D0CBA49